MSSRLKVLLVTITTIQFFLRFVLWLPVIFMLLFAYKVPSINIPYKVRLDVQRYRLPDWLNWFQTPDDVLPGPLYEQGFNNIYNRWGTWVAAWINLSFRNVAYGMLWSYGKPVTNYMVHLSEAEQKRQGVYQTVTYFGPFKILSGWAVYRIWKDTDDENDIWSHTFWAVPRFSIRFKDQD